MAKIGGLYTGIKYQAHYIDADSGEAMDEFLNNLVQTNQANSVVSVFMMPEEFSVDVTDTEPAVKDFTATRPTTLDGYVPRNNKLLTYPYISLCIDTGNSTNIYRWDRVTKASPTSPSPSVLKFKAVCGLTPNPEIKVYPVGYNGTGVDEINASDTVICNGFPQCAFAIDSYRAWLAQKSANVIGNLSAGLYGMAQTGTLSAIATGGNIPVAGTMAIAGALNTAINAVRDATRGDEARGTQGSATDVSLKVKDIYKRYMCVQHDYAEIIDNYFDKYGYTIGKLTVPQRNVRPHWTYLKTQDCDITGSIPVDDMSKIKSIYNKGITFWTSGNEVGNYSLDNRAGGGN